MAKISNSNTKAEILKAYDELLGQLKSEKSDNTALQKKLDEQKKLVEKAKQQADEGATLGIQKIRQAINQQLNELEQSLAREQARFGELQQAVEVEQDTLENLYNIKGEAESLDALIITNRQAKEKLEKEMAERKAELQGEIEATKLKWKREQEEHEYKTKIDRRKDEDEYQQRKAELEKELEDQRATFEQEMNERERVMAEKEEEFNRLKQEAETFGPKLEKAIQETEERVTQQLTREFEYQQKLQVKDLESELQLREQSIESFKAKVEEQQAYIDLLTSRTDSASAQVKDIALKAIENSGMRSLNFPTQERSRKDED